MILSEKDVIKRKAVLCEQYENIKNIVNILDAPKELQEDLVQEIFMHAYNNIRGVKDMTCLKSWLFKITIRAVQRARKTHNLRLNIEISYMPEQWEVFPVDNLSDEKVWKVLDKAITNEELHEMIDRLKPPAPEIFKLRFVNGMSLKEIAQLLEMNYNTVKTIERRALMKLKFMIMGKGEDGNEDQETR